MDTTERLNKKNKNLNAREGRFLSFLHFTLQSQFRQENKKKKERTKPSGSLEHSAEHLRFSSHVLQCGRAHLHCSEAACLKEEERISARSRRDVQQRGQRVTVTLILRDDQGPVTV